MSWGGQQRSAGESPMPKILFLFFLIGSGEADTDYRKRGGGI